MSDEKPFVWQTQVPVTQRSCIRLDHYPIAGSKPRWKQWLSVWLGHFLGPLIMAVRPYKTLHFGYWSEATGWKWMHAEKENPQ